MDKWDLCSKPGEKVRNKKMYNQPLGFGQLAFSFQTNQAD